MEKLHSRCCCSFNITIWSNVKTTFALLLLFPYYNLIKRKNYIRAVVAASMLQLEPTEKLHSRCCCSFKGSERYWKKSGKNYSKKIKKGQQFAPVNIYLKKHLRQVSKDMVWPIWSSTNFLLYPFHACFAGFCHWHNWKNPANQPWKGLGRNFVSDCLSPTLTLLTLHPCTLVVVIKEAIVFESARQQITARWKREWQPNEIWQSVDSWFADALTAGVYNNVTCGTFPSV